jgi:dihydropyrimidinase
MSALRRRDAVKTLAAGMVGLGLPAGYRPERGPRAGEILIRGGRVVNGDAVAQADVRLQDEVIAEVGSGLRPGPAAHIIEATGRLVMPGGIDAHTHLHPTFVDDLANGSMAALAGGITSVGTFAGPQGGESITAALDRMATSIGQRAIADVFLHTVVWPPTAELAASMATLALRGQPSFKIYMVQPDFAAQLPTLLEVLVAARAAGVVALIHCEDAALLGLARKRLEAEGRTSLRHYGASRPIIAEVAATQQAAALSESTGAAMHVVHLSAGRALEATKAARAAGAPLSVETRPLYLHLTEERLQGPDGPLFVGQPPLRTAADAEALWGGLADGSIDVLATDHAPWTKAQKLDPGLTITNLRPGVSDLQWMLPMYFSEGVGKRGLPLERFVATTSTNAARIFGLYPRKGVIRAGADADLVIWDPGRTGTVRAAADHSNSDYSVYEGWSVTGWPVLTIRRGEVVMEEGRVLGRPGSGRLVPRTKRA